MANGLQIAKYALGKYIIGYACALHTFWAILLLLDIHAGNSTPVSVFFALLQNRFLIAALLFFIAILGGLFLSLRLRRILALRWLSLLLIPQQLVLWCSAGAGIYAIIIQRYADGVVRSWAQISSDQAPIILMAVLYTVAVIETFVPPNHIFKKDTVINPI